MLVSLYTLPPTGVKI